MANTFLDQAAAITSDHVLQLRQLLAEVQAKLDPAAADLRHLARTLDELDVRIRAGTTQGQPTSMLARQRGQLAQRQEGLARTVSELQRAQRTLDQLIRQTEMSSAVLSGDSASPADPWHEALRAQIIQGREEERIRLAREVHDGPAQVLAHVLLGLEHSLSLSAQQKIERLAAHLGELRASTRAGLHEVRRFIADLRPPALEEQGLAAALTELAARFTAAGLITVRYEGDALPRLASEQEIVLYRIAQEALNNASKHARRASVLLQASVTARDLTLLVRDDGPGFDPRTITAKTKGKHWGLASIHERAELIGARLVISSAPGQGTAVRVTLPHSPRA